MYILLQCRRSEIHIGGGGGAHCFPSHSVHCYNRNILQLLWAPAPQPPSPRFPRNYSEFFTWEFSLQYVDPLISLNVCCILGLLFTLNSTILYTPLGGPMMILFLYSVQVCPCIHYKATLELFDALDFKAANW